MKQRRRMTWAVGWTVLALAAWCGTGCASSSSSTEPVFVNQPKPGPRPEKRDMSFAVAIERQDKITPPSVPMEVQSIVESNLTYEGFMLDTIKPDLQIKLKVQTKLFDMSGVTYGYEGNVEIKLEKVGALEPPRKQTVFATGEMLPRPIDALRDLNRKLGWKVSGFVLSNAVPIRAEEWNSR